MFVAGIHVVKLGGSLMDLADLPGRFGDWERGQPGGMKLLVVVGGGVAADVVRDADKMHALGEGRSHWLAIRAMDFNARVVGAVLNQGLWDKADSEQKHLHPGSPPEGEGVRKSRSRAGAGDGFGFAGSLEEAEVLWREGKRVIVSALAWLEREEGAGCGIGHRWTFTSDSVAGHIAVRVGAKRLTLLKSVLPAGERVTAGMLGERGIVDGEFASVVKGFGGEVWVWNLRGGPAGVEIACD